MIINRHDAPEEAVNAYAKRWKIEVFYRNAKQELGLTSCHSKYKEAHEAHIEMIFIAETMLCYANWELNKDGVIILTHGQMAREIINASHRISKRNSLQVYFDTAIAKYTSFFEKFWPKFYNLGFGLSPCQHCRFVGFNPNGNLNDNFSLNSYHLFSSMLLMVIPFTSITKTKIYAIKKLNFPTVS